MSEGTQGKRQGNLSEHRSKRQIEIMKNIKWKLNPGSSTFISQEFQSESGWNKIKK